MVTFSLSWVIKLVRGSGPSPSSSFPSVFLSHHFFPHPVVFSVVLFFVCFAFIPFVFGWGLSPQVSSASHSSRLLASKDSSQGKVSPPPALPPSLLWFDHGPLSVPLSFFSFCFKLFLVKKKKKSSGKQTMTTSNHLTGHRGLGAGEGH